MKFANPINICELAKIIDAKYDGDCNFDVLGINEIHSVQEGDITFVDHHKYYSKVLNSDASVVIINTDKVDNPQNKHLLICDDPFAAYNKIISLHRIISKSDDLIHQSAVIGENTIIQPGVFIGANVKIGDNCIINSNVSIYDGCTIGNNVIIHANSVIGADAYYFQKKDGNYRKLLSGGNVVIEDNVEIGALCSIDRGVSSTTLIGSGTKLDNHIQIGHDTVIGKNCLIGAHSAIAGVATIEDDVVIWARVSINKDVVIGAGAVILATSGVDKSLEGGKTYYGSPAIEARLKWKEIAKLRQFLSEYDS